MADVNLENIVASAKRLHVAILKRIGDPKPDMALLENLAINHLEYCERIVRQAERKG